MEVFTTVQERVAHVRALIFIASADESVTERELAHIQNFSKIYGITDEKVKTDMVNMVKAKTGKIEEILKPIKTRRQKIVLINDLLVLCYADGKYTGDEKKRIFEIAKLIDLEDNKVKEIEKINSDISKINKKLLSVLEIE